jgi:hypothetical protein
MKAAVSEELSSHSIALAQHALSKPPANTIQHNYQDCNMLCTNLFHETCSTRTRELPRLYPVICTQRVTPYSLPFSEMDVVILIFTGFRVSGHSMHNHTTKSKQTRISTVPLLNEDQQISIVSSVNLNTFFRDAWKWRIYTYFHIKEIYSASICNNTFFVTIIINARNDFDI